MTGTAIIVDDNPEVGQQIAGILTRMGIEVLQICEDGFFGQQAIIARKPTIALVDIQMPQVSGIEIVTESLKRGSQTKFVVCSGTKQQQVQDQAYLAGAALFIVKPYDQVLVERDLAKLLGG